MGQGSREEMGRDFCWAKPPRQSLKGGAPKVKFKIKLKRVKMKRVMMKRVKTKMVKLKRVKT